MNYLLDTHILIWLLNGTLSEEIVTLLQNEKHTFFMSDVSIWEICIKRKKGTLQLDFEFDIQEFLSYKNFKLLPIKTLHILNTEKLNLFHSDPFDRLLASQAQIESYSLITGDKKLWDYPISILRA